MLLNPKTNLAIFGLAGAFLALVLATRSVSHGQQSSQPPPSPRVSVDKDGTVHVPAFDVPLSSYMSEEAKRAFVRHAVNRPLASIDPTASIATRRKGVDEYYRPMVERAKALYPVRIEQQKIAAVMTDVVTPEGGVSAVNRNRVLINLHGGGFTVGAGLGALVESIPIASAGKFRVITVDYRMAPEYKFPAASEDVAAVYKELLKHYQPENIGIYGCSAGGMLTAEVVAWFQKVHLPKPGAIGIFCAGADLTNGGDSRFLSEPLDVETGLAPPPPSAPNPPRLAMAYFSNANVKDPLVSPALTPAVLSKFPPTLLISGTRDTFLSPAVFAQTQLVEVGVEADLHVWNGMWHAFFFDADLPESKEAYSVITKFFVKHLGRTSP
jgi:epsilon-lactone hydrolase